MCIANRGIVVPGVLRRPARHEAIEPSARSCEIGAGSVPKCPIRSVMAISAPMGPMRRYRRRCKWPPGPARCHIEILRHFIAKSQHLNPKRMPRERLAIARAFAPPHREILQNIIMLAGEPSEACAVQRDAEAAARRHARLRSRFKGGVGGRMPKSS